VCRATGVGSTSYWKNREGEAFEKEVGYGSFKRCEVAHGMPWSVDQPVRDVYICMLSLAELPAALVLGACSKALGRIWFAHYCGYSRKCHASSSSDSSKLSKLYALLRYWSTLLIFLSFHYLKPSFLLFISLCCDAEQ
jgi:hypothetical protein